MTSHQRIALREEAPEAFEPMLTDARPKVELYDDGSWGPAAAEALTDGVGWLTEHKVSPPIA